MPQYLLTNYSHRFQSGTFYSDYFQLWNIYRNFARFYKKEITIQNSKRCRLKLD